MSVNVDRVKKKHEEVGMGDGEFFNPDEGETLCYVHPPRADDPSEDTDGLPWLEVGLHYSVGSNRAMLVSFNHDKNPILKHPFIIEALAKRKIVLDPEEACPIEEALAEGKLGDSSNYQGRFLYGITPLAFKPKGAKDFNAIVPHKPAPLICGKQIHAGITGLIGEWGDITNPKAATLIKIKRTGAKGDRQTKYEIMVDSETARAPKPLPKAVLMAVNDATKPGGGCDLFRVVANMVKNAAGCRAVLSGMAVETENESGGD